MPLARVPPWSRSLTHSLSLSLSLSLFRARGLRETSGDGTSGRDGKDVPRGWRNVIQLEIEYGKWRMASERPITIMNFARLVYQAAMRIMPPVACPPLLLIR
jgi:hypothetical protein